MGVVRTPARAIFKNNLNMLFLNINRAIDTTCIHIDTKCNSNRHTSLRIHEIGNDSRIIYKTQRRFLWNPDIQKCYNSKFSPPPAAIFYVFHVHGSWIPFLVSKLKLFVQSSCAVMNCAHEAWILSRIGNVFRSFIMSEILCNPFLMPSGSTVGRTVSWHVSGIKSIKASEIFVV